jgi:uncharacterized protein YprB with RNaseH-like and TPR domain/Icc-related predicted phosphoesterase
MRILAFSDYRIQDIDLLIRSIERIDKPPDLIIYAGDDVRRFAPYSKDFLSGLVNANKGRMIRSLKSKKKPSATDALCINNNLWIFCGKGPVETATKNAKRRIELIRGTAGYLAPFDDDECVVQTTIDGPYTIGAIQIVEEKRNLFEKIASLSKYGLCAIIGNDDYPETRACIWGDKVYNIQETPFTVDDYAIVGIEGAIRDPKDSSIGMGYTLYTEKSLKKRLDDLQKRFRDKKLIIVSHCPPRGVLDLALRFGMRNIGSRSLRTFIEDNSRNIPLVISGHVHLQGGKNVKLGYTTIVNTASHDNHGAPGRVAIIETDVGDQNEVVWNELNELDGIYRVGPATAAKFRAAGIDTIERIVEEGVEGLMKHVGFSERSAANFYIRAKATLEKRIIPLKKLDPIDRNAVFLDIETDLTQSLVWLIGIYFKKTQEFVQLVAETQKEESKILRDFLERLNDYSGSIYTFSGTGFDERVLKNRLDVHGLDSSNLPPFVDIYHAIQSSVALPLKSYSLKSVAAYFGYEYRHPDLDGMTVAIEYLTNYQRSRNKTLLKRLLEYNEDDIRSLPWLLKQISSVVGTLEITTETRMTEIRFSCVGCRQEYSQEEYTMTRFCQTCGAHRRTFEKIEFIAPTLSE